jgi:hypothetical protein
MKLQYICLLLAILPLASLTSLRESDNNLPALIFNEDQIIEYKVKCLLVIKFDRYDLFNLNSDTE